MQITKNIYIKRNGNMTFWRLGSIGGSVYHSTNKASQEQRLARQMRHDANMLQLRAKARCADHWFHAWQREYKAAQTLEAQLNSHGLR